jgi:ribose-phosphate pyrophosphokinase
MKPIVFSLYSNATLDSYLYNKSKYERGMLFHKAFPDGESYVRIDSDVSDRKVIVIAALDRPNDKIESLIFAASALKAQGATSVGLVAPYLAYMRQDTQFNPGEAVTSRTFAKLISDYFDWIITVDPHLHRYKSLDEIYSIPSTVLHADHDISIWIKNHIEQPIIIGPDRESEQWVAKVASLARAPYLVLEKNRRGDRKVEVSIPRIDKYVNHTPVVVDDIISTAQTLIETVKHLHTLKMKPAICIGIHALFSGNAYEDLLVANVQKVVTCNTVAHPTNEIDLSSLLAENINKYL